MTADPSHIGTVAGASSTSESQVPLSKVAAVTVGFWILKVILTTAGDLAGDALSLSLKLGYARALLAAVVVFAALLAVNGRTRRFVPTLYGLLLLSSSAVGAEISDSLDRAMRWGNAAGTGVLLGALVVVLAVWFARRGTLRFAPIITRADERLYWLAAVVANSVGSAFGDWVGDGLHWGLWGATGVNLAIIALLLTLQRKSRISRGVLYWTGFVVTRIPF
ncbi:MAG: hypothetical protein ACP5P4_11480 [Steroidobacteraceae bacterium]